MSDIFQEIDEDLRRERLLGFWRRYGIAIIALAVGLLVGLGAYMAWRSYNEGKLDQHAHDLAAAAQLVGEGKHAEAAKAFQALADEAGGSYGDFARLDAAASLYDSGDVPGAVALYDQVAGSTGDASLRGLARILAVQSLIDTAKVEDLDKRLDAVTESGFAPAAKELRAYVRMKDGKIEEARRLLAELIDDATAPQRVKARATEILDALGGRLPAAPTPSQPDQPSQSEAPVQ